MMRSYLTFLTCVIGLACITAVEAQDRRAARLGDIDIRAASGALSDAVFPNAPFSADAVTTVTQTLGDGTKLEQRTTAKWYRDSTGRMRREHTVIGLDRLSPSAQPQTTITFDSIPGDPMPYTLNPATRTAQRARRGVQWLALRNGVYQASTGWSVYRSAGAANRWTDPSSVLWLGPFEATAHSIVQTAPVPPDIRPTEEELGTRQIEGVKASGVRITTLIPAGRIGNDRPIQVVSEQWESPELNMVISSRFSDPRSGVVEYRLTNINRAEPRADLFAVPAGYSIIEAGAYLDALRGGGAGQPAQGGQRGRGGRGN